MNSALVSYVAVIILIVTASCRLLSILEDTEVRICNLEKKVRKLEISTETKQMTGGD